MLNTLLNKSVEWKVMEAIRCTVRLLKVPEGSLDFYDFEEYEQMVTAAAKTSANAYLVVLFGGDAGLRVGEMRAPEWSDVNFQKRQLRVERSEWQGQVTSTKGQPRPLGAAHAPVGRSTQQHRHLRHARVLCGDRGNRFAEYHLVDLLAKVGRRANVRSNGPHILRHTFCSHLAMKGAPSRAVQELAGHRDPTTTRYVHLSPSAISDATRLLDGASPSGDILETASS